MKKEIFTLVFILVSCIFAYSQTPLPYYTGFDTPSEMAGWAEFSTGNTTAYSWYMGANPYYRSAPNVIGSPSTEFATIADTVIEWFVSPGFNFHTGGKIDSFAINVFQAGGVAHADSIVLYLLQGSNNPALATHKTRLADLTVMTTSAATLRDTGNFLIPPTPGISYIAFKYYSVYDWFQVVVDNINVSGNPTTIVEKNEHEINVSVYPTPAKNKLQISFSNSEAATATFTLVNTLGEKCLTGKVQNTTRPETIDISQLPPGAYFATITTDLKEQYVKKIVIVK